MELKIDSTLKHNDTPERKKLATAILLESQDCCSIKRAPDLIAKEKNNKLLEKWMPILDPNFKNDITKAIAIEAQECWNTKSQYENTKTRSETNLNGLF
jgi:hypothetical protein